MSDPRELAALLNEGWSGQVAPTWTAYAAWLMERGVTLSPSGPTPSEEALEAAKAAYARVWNSPKPLDVDSMLVALRAAYAVDSRGAVPAGAPLSDEARFKAGMTAYIDAERSPGPIPASVVRAILRAAETPPPSVGTPKGGEQ